MKRRLVLVGAGHAHFYTIRRIPMFTRLGVSVSVIEPAAELYYSGMAPAFLGGHVGRRSISIPTAALITRMGGTVHVGVAKEIDLLKRRIVTSREQVEFDVASFALGSIVEAPFPVDEATIPVVPVKPISGLLASPLRALGSVLVVGAGASGVEMAGALAAQGVAVTLLVRGNRLAAQLPRRVDNVVRENFSQRGIRILDDCTVTGITTDRVHLENDASLQTNGVVLATGLSVPPLFSPTELTTRPDGALVVERTLRAGGAPIFAAGDCAFVEELDLIRAGVHAVRQGPVLYHNLGATLTGGRLREYTPPRNPLLILNLGDGTGICTSGDRVYCGRACLALKLRIDWAFVRSQGARVFPTFRRPPF